MISPKVIEERKRAIKERQSRSLPEDCSKPMFSASNIHYEMSERTRAISDGGIGVIHSLVREIDLAQAIDDRVQLLKIHVPYHESDHAL